MRSTLFAAVLAAFPFVVSLPAQRAAAGLDADRKVSTFVVYEDGQPPLAAVAIAYTPAAWRAGYDEVVAQMSAANYTRLGKGWWATLEVAGAITIGGTRVAAGTYYLGLQVDQAGVLHLLLFESKRMLQQRVMSAATPLYRGDVKADLVAPLVLVKDARKESAANLVIEVVAGEKEPAKGTFVIRWGTHEATAALTFDLGVGKEGAGGKK
ncbi:MAG: hypothetical protein WAT39_14315 [Planctomycetota bacterium]